jgi:hypothetical protein
MCLLLNLRGVNNTLNYPKDTQLNTPSLHTYLRCEERPAQPCNFSYPIDFVVKHPVAPEVNPVPTLRWVRTASPCGAVQRSKPIEAFIFKQFEFAHRSPLKPTAGLNGPPRAIIGETERFGGADRDRTGDPLLAKQVLSQLSYSPLTVVVGLGRFELPTSPLSGVRSNQLSYRPAGCARVS